MSADASADDGTQGIRRPVTARARIWRNEGRAEYTTTLAARALGLVSRRIARPALAACRHRSGESAVAGRTKDIVNVSKQREADDADCRHE